jgi:hypothetical protein
MGGLISMQEAGVTPSNVLIGQMPLALASYFANRKVERPTAVESDSSAPLGLGQYHADGRVQVARNAELSPYSAQEITQHELLHALAHEHPAWSADDSAGYPALRAAIRESVPQGLSIEHQNWLKNELERTDIKHAFTDLASAGMSDRQYLPPPLAAYFAPLLGNALTPVKQESGPR